jgi:tetratricopeptide (TPR) repeat protein
MRLPRKIIIKGHCINTVWIGALLVALYYSVLILNLPGGLPAFPPAVEEPIRSLQAKVLSNPDDALAVLRLGEAYKLRGNIAIAKPLLERALRLDPALDHARFMLAEICQSERKLWRASREFLKVYRHNPEDICPALKAAECFRERWDERQAELLYREILDANPDVVLANYWLGVLLAQRDEFYGARQFLEKTLKLDPKFEGAEKLLKSFDVHNQDGKHEGLNTYWWKVVFLLFLSAACFYFVVFPVGKPLVARFRPIMTYAGIYTLSLSALLMVHYAKVSRDPALNGEELAVAFKNVLYFENRIQCDYMATNFSTTLFYWIGSHIFPLTIHSQRLLKIAVVALIPCLLLLLLKRARPNASMISKVFCVLMFILIPSISWLSTMATEFCLDCAFSLFMLWLALGLSQVAWNVKEWCKVVCIGLLVVWVAHLYGSSLPIIPVTVTIVLVRGIQMMKGAKRHFVPPISMILIGCALGAAILWPLAYFKGHQVTMFSGGGRMTLSPPEMLQNFSVIMTDMFVQSTSYLVGGDVNVPAFPIWGFGAPVVCLALVGVVAVVRQRNVTGLSLVAIIVLSLVVAGVASINPGIRRVVPAVACFVVLASIGLDWMLEYLKASRNGLHSRMRTILVLMCGLVVILSLRGWIGTMSHISRHYNAWLQREFNNLPEKNYEESIECLVQHLQNSKITLSKRDCHRDYLVLLYLICSRRNQGYIPPFYDGDWDYRLNEVKAVDKKGEGRSLDENE